MRHFRTISLLASLVILAGLYFCPALAFAAPAFTPESYGAKGDGAADDTGALTACFAAASAVRGTVAPTGHYLTRQTIPDVNVAIAATNNAYIRLVPPAGFVGPVMTIANTQGRSLVIQGLRVIAGGSGKLGVLDTKNSGFQVLTGPVMVRDCQTQFVYAGVDIESTNGHVYLDNDDLGGYYSVWSGVNTGDNKFVACRMSAGFACIGYGALGFNVTATSCAMGFSPFAAYQVATDAAKGSGLFHSTFTDCSFEALGNEGFCSEYARAKPCPVIVNTTDLKLTGCGFTYVSAFTLPGYPTDKDIEMDAPQSEITYDGGIYPLTKGIYFARPSANANQITITYAGASASVVTVGPGQKAPAMSILGAM